MKNLCSKCFHRYKELLLKKDQIKNSIGYLNKIFLSAFVISLSIIILKLTGQKQVEWEHLKFDFKNIWIIYVILTLAHLFIRTALINAINQVLNFKFSELHDEVFTTVVSSDNLFFNGFIPKYSYAHKGAQIMTI